uniref:Uncharacterized protein n=1 Tax=Coccidioides posadasii RMSCC 3488 TaxID=454284 RepID=A0A0J6HYK5_COCPO|nr:hypothetical protein CPAG_00409 [Coccidioides posadasii RMSCC 3488]
MAIGLLIARIRFSPNLYSNKPMAFSQMCPRVYEHGPGRSPQAQMMRCSVHTVLPWQWLSLEHHSVAKAPPRRLRTAAQAVQRLKRIMACSVPDKLPEKFIANRCWGPRSCFCVLFAFSSNPSRVADRTSKMWMIVPRQNISMLGPRRVKFIFGTLGARTWEPSLQSGNSLDR